MTVDFVLLVTDLPRSDILAGTFLEPDEAQPFNAFRRTSERFEVEWTPATRFAMGTANDLTVGSLLRVVGRLGENHLVQAEKLVVLTRVARVL